MNPYIVKSIERFEKLLNLQFTDGQKEVLYELKNYSTQFFRYVDKRGTGKSYAMALYVLDKMLFNSNRKIVVTAPSFRQSKIIFSYMQQIWDHSNLLGLMSFKTFLSSDKAEIEINDNICSFLPLSNGEKIRGLRPNILCCDEAHIIDRETLETIYHGMAAANGMPWEGAKNSYQILETQVNGL